MPSIEIVRHHNKKIADARTSVSNIAQSIGEEFQVEHYWRADILYFSRSGISGEIALSKGKVLVTAEVSFMLFAITGTIKSEIERFLEQEFAS